jgi:MoaA/NifB/PqqE/SkfB family radical SAM enzyme
MNQSELERQNLLKLSKPQVYDKVVQHSMRIVRVEYSYLCNMRCEHCIIRDMPKFGRSLKIEDIKYIADQADELGFAQFVITGGEPLLFEEFDRIVDAIGRERFYITTDTNGWYCDRQMAKHLKEIGVDKVQVSIDSLKPEEHDNFRQKRGAWSRAVNAVEYCKDTGLNTIVQTVVDKKRVYSNELMMFIEFWNGLDVPVCILYAKPVGAWKGRYDLIIGKKELEIISEIEKTHRVFSHLTPAYDWKGGCIAVKRMINITKYGEVNPCPVMQEYSLGNIFDEPLADIVKRGMKKFRKHIPYCVMAMDKDFVNALYD